MKDENIIFWLHPFSFRSFQIKNISLILYFWTGKTPVPQENIEYIKLNQEALYFLEFPKI
jgi:hypothetical protein